MSRPDETSGHDRPDMPATPAPPVPLGGARKTPHTPTASPEAYWQADRLAPGTLDPNVDREPGAVHSDPDVNFAVPATRARRGGWFRRNATATGTVVGVVIVLVAISVGTGVALTSHSSQVHRDSHL